MGSSLRRAVYLLGLVALLAATGGCSNQDSQHPEPSEAGGSTTSRSSGEIPPPLAGAGTGRKTRKPDPGAVAISLTNITVIRKDDHDQTVLEFTGSSIPGWAVQYVDQPVQNGTGQLLVLPGRSTLEVLVLEAPGPFTAPVNYAGPDVVINPGSPQINAVRYSATASGITQIFISVNGLQPAFAVSTLTNPTRVIIDVAD